MNKSPYPYCGGYTNDKDIYVISMADHDLYRRGQSGNYFALGICEQTQRITFTWIVTNSGNIASVPEELAEMRTFAKAHRNLMS